MSLYLSPLVPSSPRCRLILVLPPSDEDNETDDLAVEIGVDIRSSIRIPDDKGERVEASLAEVDALHLRRVQIDSYVTTLASEWQEGRQVNTTNDATARASILPSLLSGN